MAKGSIDLEERFPIKVLDENLMLNATLDVSAGYSLMWPEVYCHSAEDYEEIHKELSMLIKRIPPGGFIQFLGHYFEGKFDGEYTGPSPLQKQNFTRWQERPLLNSFTRCFVSFCNPQYDKPSQFRSSLLRPIKGGRDKFLTEADLRVKEFKTFLPSFSSSFSAIPKLKVRRLNTEELRASLFDYWALGYPNSLKASLAKSVEIPDPEIETGYFKIGNQYVAFLSLVREGDKLTASQPNKKLGQGLNGIQVPERVGLPSSMLMPLSLGLPFNHMVNVGIKILDNSAVESENSGFGTLGLEIQRTVGSSQAALKLAEKQAYVNTLTQYHHQACHVCVSVIIQDADLALLKEKINYAVNAFKNMNDSFARVEGPDLANLFWNTSPGNAMHNYRIFNQTVDQAVGYIPKEDQYYSDSEGLVFKDRFGNPFVLNFWKSVFINARNGIVLGPTGTGKSVSMNYMVDQLYSWGNTIIIIDKGGSYKRLCGLHKGKYFDSAEQSTLRFNIFICKKDKIGNFQYNGTDADGEGVNDQIEYCYAIIRRIWKKNSPISNEETVILKDMIVKFYDHVNENKIFPTLIEFDNFVELYEEKIIKQENKQFINFRSLHLLLSPYTEGSYVWLLNSKENELLTSQKFIVFDLEAISKNPDLFDIVSIIVLDLATQIIEKDHVSRKTIILEEAIDFLQGNSESGESMSDMGDFTAAMYRKIRKRNGQMLLVTQGVSYLKFIHPIIRESIFSNSDIKLLLEHSGKNEELIEDTKKYLGLSSFQEEQLRSLEMEKGKNYRGGLLVLGTYSKVVRFELNPYSYAVYNTDKTEIEALKALEIKYGSLGAAINEYIYQKEVPVLKEQKRV